ncbi:MAG: hypothetical protein WB624_23365 [Xanthobacteraceae bacterium]|jgi:hypothetical protein
MRKLALGIVAATALMAVSAPAMAQVGFYAGPSGIEVGVGPPAYGPAPYGYYDYYGGPNVVVAPGWHHWHHWHHWR